MKDKPERCSHCGKPSDPIFAPDEEIEWKAWTRKLDIKLGYESAATLAVDNTEEGTS